eukprot:SAG31_NODE_20997_length_560_cov_0.689805_1_plen_52_part_10
MVAISAFILPARRSTPPRGYRGTIIISPGAIACIDATGIQMSSWINRQEVVN